MKIDPAKLRELITHQSVPVARLARAAGLSRQALQAILNKDRAEVRRKTLQGLVRALKLPDENALFEDPLTGYKARVAEEHAHLDFRGLGLPTTEPRLLEALFVPVRVRRMTKRKHDKGCVPPASENGAEPEDPSLTVEEESGKLTVADCLARHRRFLLRGEPGSGKTTSLRHITRSYARGTQSQDRYPTVPLTPLFVRLADYAKARERDGELSVVRFVVNNVLPETSPASAAALERLLEEDLRRGNCLVLFDGLDEIGRDRDMPAVLRDLVVRCPDNWFVLTSRVVGLDAGPGDRLNFVTCDIAGWREEDIRDFASRWYASRHGEGGEPHRKENERRAEELSAALLDHPALREIATNPLMLTILAALHHANASLPRRRVDLYAKVVEVLLETWEAEKRNARPADPLHGIVLDPREFEWLLSRMALAMQRNDHTLAPRWWVTEFVQQFLRDSLALEGENAKDQGDRVIRHLCERSGLLVERGADVFGFSHRTFQEYFAARGILEEASEGSNDALVLLRPYLYHPRWEEVVRLVSAQLAPTQATALLRTILDDPDPAGRFLKRGLRLALRCLSYGAAVADRRLLNQVFSGGSAIGESKWLGITLDIIDALLDLKTTRYANDVGKMLAAIELAARSTLAPPESLGVYEAVHGPLWDKEFDGPPGTVSEKEFDGHPWRIVSLAPQLWRDNPTKWYAGVLPILRKRATNVPVKLMFIEGPLRYDAERNEQARGALESFLTRDRSPSVRAACAWALQRTAVRHPSTVNRLLERLTKDDSDDVRLKCASSLWEVTPRRRDIREQLMGLLESSASEGVRAGAVLGLWEVALADPALLASFVSRACSPQESASVRMACLSVIEEALEKDPSVSESLLSCLDESATPAVQRVSAQLVAEALANGRLTWSPEPVAKAEAVLMTVTNPCPHAWRALGQLVDAKEIHGGLRLERVLGAALESFENRISMAFIFGSVARREQHRDSDIDLLILGDVRLKELVGKLHTAEQGLGHVINPVLYTPTSFKEKYTAGDPFLLEVVRNEKIFLKGDTDELRELVAERESPETPGDPCRGPETVGSRGPRIV